MRKLNINILQKFILIFCLTVLTGCQIENDEGFDSIDFGVENNLLLKSNYTKETHDRMMFKLQTEIDDILLYSKPSNISLTEYKIKLIDGEFSLPKRHENLILEKSLDLINYGKYLVATNSFDLDSEDESEMIALGGLFSPDNDLSISFPIPGDPNIEPGYIYQTNGLTWGDVAVCAAVAIGADLVWSLGAETGATAWGTKAITKAFTKVASRFLGPIGVAIAVTTFGVCLAQSA